MSQFPLLILLIVSQGQLGEGSLSDHMTWEHGTITLEASARRVYSDGTEPVDQIFQKAKCVKCHKIPGVQGAQGTSGPTLIMGTIAPHRPKARSYTGHATTVREYVEESILFHNRYVVPGYRKAKIQDDYTRRLSAGALQVMVEYLSGLEQGHLPTTRCLVSAGCERSDWLPEKSFG